MPICNVCKQEKTLDRFVKTDKIKCGYFSNCKECRNKRAKELSLRPKKTPNYKECHSCKNNYECNSNNFCKNNRNISGFSNICKKCILEREINKVKQLGFIDEKACNRCKIIKKITEFHNDVTKSFGKSNTCKCCEKERGKRRYVKDVQITVSEQRCSRCLIVKNSAEFAKSRLTKTGLRGICRECGNIKYNTYIKENPHIKFNIRLKYQYGITREKYDNELKICQNKCFICGQENKLVIDHNHQTGEYRGLICGQCNSGIGFLKDSPEVLDRAALYLRKDLNKNQQQNYSSDELLAISNI